MSEVLTITDLDQQPSARFAAAVYGPGTTDRMALIKFAEKQRAKGTRVGGVLQEAIIDRDGVITGLDAVDVVSGRRIPISRPPSNPGECGLDVSALADTAGLIRNAIDQAVDLVVVEKFGELEQEGKGLIDEILQAIAEDIPLIISVSSAALPLWQERSGELGSVLAFDEDVFEEWWRRVSLPRD